MDTGNALYRAICQNPKEDTPRLMYADYLDETGIPEYVIHAEYIRLSIASEYPPLKASFVDMANWENNRKRAKQILTENYDRWTHLKCELCPKSEICKYCGGIGDAYRTSNRRHGVHDEIIEDAPMRGVTYHKGFPIGITCRMSEVLLRRPNDLEKNLYPIVTEWAKSIARRTPITMFKPLDYRPNQQAVQTTTRYSSGAKYVYVWTDTMVRSGIYSHSLPTWLFNMVWELAPKYADTGCKESHSQVMGSRVVVCISSEQAYEILSTVIGNVIRGEVYGSAL